MILLLSGPSLGEDGGVVRASVVGLIMDLARPRL